MKAGRDETSDWLHPLPFLRHSGAVGFSPQDIVTCFEVTDEIVDEALRPAASLLEASPRERVFRLLDHMAKIAAPRTGSSRILEVLGRVGGCDWVDGNLVVKVLATETGCTVRVLLDDGVSVTKMRDELPLPVPAEELFLFVERRSELVRPLVVTARGETYIQLSTEATSTRSDTTANPVIFTGSSLEQVPPEPPPPLPPKMSAVSVVGRVPIQKKMVPVPKKG